jgi:hypothetical protein
MSPHQPVGDGPCALKRAAELILRSVRVPRRHVVTSLLLLALVILAGTTSWSQSNALTNADIIKMVQARLSSGVISQAIDSAPAVAFDTSPDGLIALNAAGVSDAIVSVMIKRAGRSPSKSSPSPSPSPSPSASPRAAPGAEVDIPDGTQVPLRLLSAASSATSKAGDPLRFSVMQDIKVGAAVVIEKNATATGRINEAKKSGTFGRGGTLKFVVESVTAADGSPIPLRFSRELKGAGNTGGAVDMATSAATGSTSRVIDSAKGQILAKGAEITVRSGTQYEVFTDGVHHVVPSSDRRKR